VEEIDSDGFDFRVAGRGFVWSYPERRPGQPRIIRPAAGIVGAGFPCMLRKTGADHGGGQPRELRASGR
jgi:hypothetical protein